MMHFWTAGKIGTSSEASGLTSQCLCQSPQRCPNRSLGWEKESSSHELGGKLVNLPGKYQAGYPGSTSSLVRQDCNSAHQAYKGSTLASHILPSLRSLEGMRAVSCISTLPAQHCTRPRRRHQKMSAGHMGGLIDLLSVPHPWVSEYLPGKVNRTQKGWTDGHGGWFSSAAPFLGFKDAGMGA